MADERARRGQRRVLSRGALLRSGRRLPLLLLAALVAALAVGPSSVTAESPERSFGRVIVTVLGVAGDGPVEPVRYEVDAVLSSESSRFRTGVVCRFELPLVAGDASAVVALDLDRNALLGERALPLDGIFAALDYREVAPGGLETFRGVAAEGDVLLLAMGAPARGLVLHVAFGARVVDAARGTERLLTDGEAASLPDEATHPSTVVVWRDEAPPDVVYLDALYVSSDCSGDPLYEPGYVIEPAAYGPEPYGDEVDDGGWGGVDWGYGEDYVGEEPDDGWDGWSPDDDWSGGDGINDDGGTIDGGDGGGWYPDDGGWYPDDGVNDDGGGSDDGSFDDGGFDDGAGDGWDEGYDSGGGCGGEDDPGSEDDSLDCAGDDPSGGDGGFDCDSGGGDSSSGDEVDTSCDGSGGDSGSSDSLDCDAEARAAPTVSAADGARKAPRTRRWRGWNLAPLLGFLAWWAFLRFRRGAPLRRRVECGDAGPAQPGPA